jgi:hypothetical protein
MPGPAYVALLHPGFTGLVVPIPPGMRYLSFVGVYVGLIPNHILNDCVRSHYCPIETMEFHPHRGQPHEGRMETLNCVPS